jgi:hypothetical protein
LVDIETGHAYIVHIAECMYIVIRPANGGFAPPSQRRGSPRWESDLRGRFNLL